MVDELHDKKNLTEPQDLVKPGKGWRGFPTWSCGLCSYNDTDYERTVWHLKQIHFPDPQPKQTVRSSLVDPQGRPFLMEV